MDVPRSGEPVRRRAVEHYRAALTLDDGSTLGRLAGRKAWRLAAGLPPVALRFACTWD